MIKSLAKNLGYYEKESISDSVISIKQIKLGELGCWDYYGKLAYLKDCEENIQKMLFKKPAKYIINHAGPHWFIV